MNEFNVDPADLNGAAKVIGSALGDYSGSRLPDFGVGGAAYGNDGLGRAVTEFAGAVRVAGDVLTSTANKVSAGLQRASSSYVRADASSFAALLGVGASLPSASLPGGPSAPLPGGPSAPLPGGPSAPLPGGPSAPLPGGPSAPLPGGPVPTG
jgi:hypothetical protein